MECLGFTVFLSLFCNLSFHLFYPSILVYFLLRTVGFPMGSYIEYNMLGGNSLLPGTE